jgi:molybdopterin synthase catalytic subunit
LQIVFHITLLLLRFSLMAPLPSSAVSTIRGSDVQAGEFPILLFAALKDAAGSARIIVRVEGDGTITNGTLTVRELLEHCGHQHPSLARWLAHVRVAVNQEYSGLDQTVLPGDEIALLPPVAGGAAKAKGAA